MKELKCHNMTCTSKANGSQLGAAFNALMVLALSSNETPQVLSEEHPRFFVREIHKG
jgi:hypothetical protein